MRRAIIVGNSDGIGLALTRRLMDDGWSVTGLSRSAGPLTDHVVDVTATDYPDVLAGVGPAELCVYAAGVGELDDLSAQTRSIEVNLLGAARTVDVVVPPMLEAGSGHVIGLSSLADRLISAEAPGYAASKAGMSSYLLGLNAALRPRGVAVSTIRFGFVDTKMAKAPRTPLKISVDQAVDVLMRCVRTRPAVVSYPRRAALAAGLLGPLARAAARRR